MLSCRSSRLSAIALIIGTALALGSLRRCRDEVPVFEPSAGGLAAPLPAAHYAPPIIKLPFVKTHQPVVDANLPIPASRVRETIVLKPSVQESPITLVIDRRGEIYTSNDTPAETSIAVTRWRPPVIEFCNRFSAGILISDNAYVALGYDPLKIWRFYFGADIGRSLVDSALIIGTAVRFRITGTEPDRLNVTVSVGNDWARSKLYVGIGVGW